MKRHVLNVLQKTTHKENIKQFYNCHANRQGIAVLAFSITSGTIENLHERYVKLHPGLLVKEYVNSVKTYNYQHNSCKVLEVYSYYKGDTKDGEVDKGTRLRFIQQLSNENDDDEHNDDELKDVDYHCLPGIVPINATFDKTCMSAYCDHWVSNGTFYICIMVCTSSVLFMHHNHYKKSPVCYL